MGWSSDEKRDGWIVWLKAPDNWERLTEYQNGWRA